MHGDLICIAASHLHEMFESLSVLPNEKVCLLHMKPGTGHRVEKPGTSNVR